MAAKNRLSRRQGALYTLPSQYASQGENVQKVRLLCRLRTNFWLLTNMFSHLFIPTLEALKMAKSLHCAETTHHSKTALGLNVLHIE